jgi:hypothetical protein
MGTALGLEYLVARLTHAAAEASLVAMLLGSVVAMMGSMALTDHAAWPKIRTALFFPVAIGVGLLAGVAVGTRTDLMLAVFVVVMFASVYVRRFGVVFFFYGFMGWMGYFFASFLHATVPMLPALFEAVIIGAAWVLLLSLTVLRINVSRTLRRTIRAFDLRARAVARAAAELLEHRDADAPQLARLRRRLRARQARLAESALIVEAWSVNQCALPPGWSAPALRRKLIDAQQIVDGLAAAADALIGADAQLAAAALALLDRLARRDDTGANRAAHVLAEAAERAVPPHADRSGASGWWPARHLAAAALEFIALARSAEVPPAVEELDEFEPVVNLAMGNLPGSPAVASNVPARGGRWNPLARLDMPSRQAIQVAVAGTLAILVGRELSETRYYWAVLAAFVMFAGTGTRAETTLKGFNRVLGTLVGLFASIGLADLTAGHTDAVLVVIVGAMFCGFYLITISYAYMIFFITIMVGQLYSVLGEFSDGLLVLRLEETSIGAAIGFLVALLVVPLSTRDTVRTARDNLLAALAELLTGVADRLAGGTLVDAGPDLDRLARGLDDRVRQLSLVARPLTRPLLWGNSPLRTRHRLALYAATATHARELTVAIRRSGRSVDPAIAARALATAATRLTVAAVGSQQPAAAEPLAKADNALFAHSRTAPGARATDPVYQPLIRLHQLLRELAAPGSPLRTEAMPSAVAGTTTVGSPAPTPAQRTVRLPAGQPRVPVRQFAQAIAQSGTVVRPRAQILAEDDEPDSAALTGTITLGSGQPLAGGVLLLLDAAGHRVARAKPDRDGRYRINACPPGRYVAAVSAKGHRPVALRVTLQAHQLTRADLVVDPN